MMNPSHLIQRYLDDRLSDEQFAELRAWIMADPKNARQFARYCILHSHMRSRLLDKDLQVSLKLFTADQTDLSDPAADTKTIASEVILDATSETSEEQVRRIQRFAEQKLQTYLAEQESQQSLLPSRVPIWRTWDLRKIIAGVGQKIDRALTLIARTAVAAVVLISLLLAIVAGLHFAFPPRVVASLGPCVQARWADPLEGEKLRVGWMALQEGYAELTFQQGAQVRLQAPCRFKLLSANAMYLEHGNMTALVPPEASGFTVGMEEAEIIDYGTEFGVAVNAERESEIHVFRGEIGLQSSKRTASSVLHKLIQGQAAWTARDGGFEIGKAADRPHLFLHDRPRAGALGIPGKRINLADIVGGGNGFGTGRWGGYDLSAEGTLNPITGRFDDSKRPDNPKKKGVSGRYDEGMYSWPGDLTPVPGHPYIDGLLIPDAGEKPCIVSSRGHVFKECPDTSGLFKLNVVNGWRHRHNPFPAVDGDAYLTQRAGITLHANCGITFDLRAIQRDMSGKRVARFRAEVHVPKRKWSNKSDMDIWLLVDGEVGFVRRNVGEGLVFPIDLPLPHDQRFLTLMVTEGQKEGIFSDRCFFADAVLELDSL